MSQDIAQAKNSVLTIIRSQIEIYSEQERIIRFLATFHNAEIDLLEQRRLDASRMALTDLLRLLEEDSEF